MVYHRLKDFVIMTKGGVLIRGNRGTSKNQWLFAKYFFERRKEMKKLLAVLMTVAVLTSFLAVPAFSADTDKLIVKDSAGTNNVFVVTDYGTTKVGGSGNYVGAFGLSSVANAWFARNAYYDSVSGWQRSDTTQYAVVDQQYGDAGSGKFQIYTAAPGANPIANWVKQFEVSTSGNTFINGRLGIGVGSPTHRIQLSGGAYSDGSSWVNASSKALKDNIKELSATAAMDAFTKLDPVTFTYKEEGDQTRVGFIAEDVPSLVAMKDRKGLSAMDIVAVLTKVVQEQQKTINELSQKLNKLQSEINARGVVASTAK